MIVKVEVLAGNDHKEPKKSDIDKNIAAVERAISGKSQAGDFVSLTDTLSILKGIRQQLPNW